MPRLNMAENRTNGILLTFCGLDGCGKTTMIQALVERLRSVGYTPLLTKQPTDFVRESAIFRNFMDCPEHDSYDYRSLSLLAASDRVQHANRFIRPALNGGEIVISDRYFYSCLANLRARGYIYDKWIYEVAESILQPDAAFFLDASVGTAVSRVRQRPQERDRFIDMELQYRLHDEYLAIARANGGIVISSEQPLEKACEEMMDVVWHVLEKKKERGNQIYA